MMSDCDPDTLKVTELRDALQSRGLDVKGNKAALVSRLKEALGMATDAPGKTDVHPEISDSSGMQSFDKAEKTNFF